MFIYECSVCSLSVKDGETNRQGYLPQGWFEIEDSEGNMYSFCCIDCLEKHIKTFSSNKISLS